MELPEGFRVEEQGKRWVFFDHLGKIHYGPTGGYESYDAAVVAAVSMAPLEKPVVSDPREPYTPTGRGHIEANTHPE